MSRDSRLVIATASAFFGALRAQVQRVRGLFVGVIVAVTTLGYSGCVLSQSSRATGPVATSGPRFEAVVGAGTALCDSYASRLRNPTDRWFISGQNVFPQLDFGRKRSVDEPSQPELLERVAAFLWDRDINPAAFVPNSELGEWRGTPEQLARAHSRFINGQFRSDFEGDWGYRIGRIDIDNDGNVEPVLLQLSPHWSTLLVLTDDESEVDVEMTEKILHHPSRAAAGWPEVRPGRVNERLLNEQSIIAFEQAWGSVHYGVFTYDNKIYVDLWWTRHPEFSAVESLTRGSLRVFLTEGDVSHEVCVIRRRQNTEP